MVRLALPLLVALTLVGLTLVGCSQDKQGKDLTITIPRGTAAEVDRGINRGVVPSQLTGKVGDVLVVVNKDNADQHVGPFFVARNQTLRYNLTRAGVYRGACTLSKTDDFTLTVRR